MPDDPQQPTTALAERAKANPLVLVDDVFSNEEVQAIGKFIGVNSDDPAFRPFLAVAASLGLSPLNGEIWLIKGRREENRQWVDFYRPAVGRDGFLVKAEESPKFGGIRSGTVCANDTFEVEDDGNEVTVLHRFKSLGPDAESGRESRYRGAVIGAWAKVFFTDGRPPIFYFAPAHEHVKTKVNDGNREYQGAWSYTSAMCEKAAQSRVLRLAFRLTGVVPVDEIRADDAQMTSAAPSDGAPAPASLGDDDPGPANAAFIEGLDLESDTKLHLVEALEAINDLSPFSWTVAKLRMRLGSDCTEARAREVLGEIEGEFHTLRGKEAEREAREEAVQDAVEIVKAKDLRGGVELHADDQWTLVADVILDEEEGRAAVRLSDDRELLIPLEEDLEVRQPPEGGDSAEG